MTPQQIDAMKLALEELAVRFSEGWHEGIKIDASDIMLLNEAAQALAQPEQEAVAWSHAGAMPPEQEVMKEAAYNLAPWLSAALDDPKVCKEYKDVINAWFDAAMPAPQRTWVGLTGEDVVKAYDDYQSGRFSAGFMGAIRSIEAKLKQKNGFAEEKNT